MNPLFSFLDPVIPSITVAVAMFGLTSARFVGVMVIMPLFTRSGIDGILRIGIAVSLSAPLTLELTKLFTVDTPPPLWMLSFLIGKEVLIGMALGLIFSAPIWAISTAGDIIDSYRNASAANTTDPVNATEISVFGTYLVILGLALFIAAGGLQIMIASIYKSYGLWPITSFFPVMKFDNVSILYSFLYDVGRLAFIIAAPIMIIMIVVDITMMGFTRMNPQFQVFESSNALKNLALILLLPIYVSFFSDYMNVQWPKLFSTIDRLILN